MATNMNMDTSMATVKMIATIRRGDAVRVHKIVKMMCTVHRPNQSTIRRTHFMMISSKVPKQGARQGTDMTGKGRVGNRNLLKMTMTINMMIGMVREEVLEVVCGMKEMQ